MEWDAFDQIEAAEPATRQIQMNRLAEPPFGLDVETVYFQKHPGQEFRINLKTTIFAIDFCEMRRDLGQIREPINRTQQVILRNVIFHQKFGKIVTRTLPALVPPCPIPPHRTNWISGLLDMQEQLSHRSNLKNSCQHFKSLFSASLR